MSITYTEKLARRRVARQSWTEERKQQEAIYQRKANRRYKREIVEAYGGACQCCGEDRWQFLTLDHINGDGWLKRKLGGSLQCGTRAYTQLQKAGWPKHGYRLLCFNCNTARGFYGYCPHEPNTAHLADEWFSGRLPARLSRRERAIQLARPQ